MLTSCPQRPVVQHKRLFAAHIWPLAIVDGDGVDGLAVLAGYERFCTGDGRYMCGALQDLAGDGGDAHWAEVDMRLIQRHDLRDDVDPWELSAGVALGLRPDGFYRLHYVAGM